VNDVRPVPPDVVPIAVDAVTVVNAPAAGVTLPIMPCSDVAVATPRVGVTRVGEVASTLLPVPVLVTETMFLLASNAKAVEAVKPDNVAVLDADRVVNAPAAAVDEPTGPLNESPTAPVWKSFSWLINSRIASLMPLGAQPSAMLIESMSVLLAGVLLNSLIFVLGISVLL
jgi:hypothetical protein